MKKKLLYVALLSILVVSICLAAGCGCNKDKGTLKSEAGVVLTGGSFDKGAKLVTEKLDVLNEDVQQALKALPDDFPAYEAKNMVVMDISVTSNGVKVQPNGKVKVSVPTPIKGVSEYLVYHIKSETESEKLPCEYKKGKLTFETDSFSKFVFGDANKGEKITVSVEGYGEGLVRAKMAYGFWLSMDKTVWIDENESATVYVEEGKYYNLTAKPDDGYDFLGWYEKTDGVTADEPFSTEEFLSLEIKGERSLVAKFKANMEGVYQVWAFPGKSGLPSQYKDGRTPKTIYVKPGNPKNLDIGAIAVVGLKRNKSGDLIFVRLAPDQYVMTGVDEIDYDKEGNYTVWFKATVDGKEYSNWIELCVSEKNGDLAARALTGGKFYIEENDKVLFTHKEFFVSDMTSRIQLTAVPDEVHDFDGWYVYGDGGVIGDKLSDEPVYELTRREYDFTVVARFKIKPQYSNKKGVYQLWIYPGESGIAQQANGEIVHHLYLRPGKASIDLQKLEIKGLRRTADDKELERVLLHYDDYTVDYDGLDFAKEGEYEVKFYVNDARFLLDIHISSQHATLDVGFYGYGKIIPDGNPDLAYEREGHGYVIPMDYLRNEKKFEAVADDGYKFSGWYSEDENGNLSEKPVSTDKVYTFVQQGVDLRVRAVFVEDVTKITAECGGFEDGRFIYNVSAKEQADLTSLVVKTERGTILNPSDYTVDASAVNYAKTGEYNITITYKYDDAVKCHLVVEVPTVEVYAYIMSESDGSINGVIKLNGNVVVNSPEGHPEYMDLGGKITLSAEGNEGYKFAGWFVRNDFGTELRYVSDNATETFDVTDATYIYAKFVEKDKVTFTVIAGEGGKVYEYVPEGTSQPKESIVYTVPEGAKVKVSASESYSYTKFAGWFDGEGEDANLISKDALHEFTVTENAVVYARFEKAFFISARIENVNGGRFTNGSSAEDGFYREDLPENSEVTIGVTANDGYVFVGWFVSSDVYSEEHFLSKEPEHTFVLNESTGNMHVTALFRKTVTEVRLEDSGDYGFVLSEDGKLVTSYTVDLNEEFHAFPQGIRLLGKSGEEFVDLLYNIEYEITSDIYYTENGMFDTSKAGTFKITYVYIENPELKATITIQVLDRVTFGYSADRGGYITDSEGNPTDGMNGKKYERGTTITLTAVAEYCYEFAGWYYYSANQTETLISTEATYTFALSGDLFVFARFNEKETCNFIAYPGEAGYITDENGKEIEFGNGKRMEKGDSITITANVRVEGYEFVGWYYYAADQTETLISTEATHTFTVNEDMYVYARYAQTATNN